MGLVFAVLGVAAMWIAQKSICRLFFVDVSIALRSGSPPRAVEAKALIAAKRSILVVHALPALAKQLRARCCVDLSQEPLVLGEQVGMIPDLIDVLASKTARANLASAVSPVRSAVRVGDEGRRVLVLSRADPWRRLKGEDRREWAKILTDFEVRVCAPRDAPGTDACATDEDDPAGALAPQAAFIAQWTDSDDDEQRVLAQLAIDRHPSPSRGNCSTLLHLARRGLLDPCTLTIRDPCFADFVRREVSGEELDAFEQSEGPTPWKTLRVPLLTAGSAVVAILGYSSPELQATGAIFPAVFAGMQVVLRALGAPEPALRG
jgi:hypothetical protein